MCISIISVACERADAIARQADVVAALTLEVLKGTTNAFDSGEYCIGILKTGLEHSTNENRQISQMNQPILWPFFLPQKIMKLTKFIFRLCCPVLCCPVVLCCVVLVISLL